MADSADTNEMLHSAASDLGQTVYTGLYVPIISVITIYLGFLFRVSNSIDIILYPQISYFVVY